VSHSSDEIIENAEATAFVPELQRLSILWETFGCMPSISDIIAELYWSVAQLENKTASISFPEMPFFRISEQGSHASSSSGIFESLANFEVAHEEIATLRTSKG
jgi:hypothetical protein